MNKKNLKYTIKLGDATVKCSDIMDFIREMCPDPTEYEFDEEKFDTDDFKRDLMTSATETLLSIESDNGSDSTALNLVYFVEKGVKDGTIDESITDSLLKILLKEKVKSMYTGPEKSVVKAAMAFMFEE